jgi:tetratricopeptide (TPR) repeat protein
VHVTVAEKSEKMTKRELREPDAFQRFGVQASDWLIKHQNHIGLAVVGIAVVWMGLALVNYFIDRGEERAAKQLGQAMQVLTRPVEGDRSQGGSMEPPFKTQQEKDEAVRKALGKFREEHKGTQAAMTAALPLGEAEYRLGNHEAALAAFTAFLQEAPKEDPLRAKALEGQGYAYEAQGKHDQALSSFDQMAQVESGDYLKGMGQYHRARVLVQLGRKDEAAQALADLKASQPDTAAGRLATERLAVLASQGVKVPEPKAAPPATGQDVR